MNCQNSASSESDPQENNMSCKVSESEERNSLDVPDKNSESDSHSRSPHQNDCQAKNSDEDDTIKNGTEDRDLKDDITPRTLDCPKCNKSIQEMNFNNHIMICLGVPQFPLRKLDAGIEMENDNPESLNSTLPNIESSEKSMEGGMSEIQKAYLAIQHQQMLQIQLIRKIQAQMSFKGESQNVSETKLEDHESFNDRVNENNISSFEEKNEENDHNNAVKQFLERLKSRSPHMESDDHPKTPVENKSPVSSTHSVSGMLNSEILSPEAPASMEMNSLEKLQQTANHVLNEASHGIFTNHLIEEANSSDPRDGSTKHKCRFCGKVFGSDSGLQIHLRSHTGERPFKCNICGNRFTTRGNLKVHFQRHQSRFPHIKMNHNPVPEHLDKFYVPLLAQLGEMEQTPPAPTGPPDPFAPVVKPGFSPFDTSISRLSINQTLPSSVEASREMGSPQNFNGHFHRESEINNDRDNESISSQNDGMHTNLSGENIKSSNNSNPDNFSDRMMREGSSEKSDSRERDRDLYDENDDMDLNNDGSDCSNDSEVESPINPHFIRILQEQGPEGLTALLQRMKCHMPVPMLPGFLNPLNNPNMPELPPGISKMDLLKDPNLYSNLLPRPGSTDNSWEALIEVQKTSETMKLEQLVNNIENKLTDPNQCVICQRVLSCKSALQMHYRIHTGERPYKCKICSRTFTTKGNLKTHMSVHRARPPVRMLHQCPVCYKRYNNGMLLQQHIRSHKEGAEFLHRPPNGVPNFMPPFLFPRLPGLPPHMPGFLPFMRHPDLPMSLEPPNPESLMKMNSEILRSSRTADHNELIESKSSGIDSENESNKSVNDMDSSEPIDFSTTLRNKENSHSEGDDKEIMDDKNEEKPHPNGEVTHLEKSFLPEHLKSVLGASMGSIFPPLGLFPNLVHNSPIPLSQPLSIPGSNSFLASIGQGTTTCKICRKTLSCSSALEIHMRSHTRDRPFLCTICDRRFTTRGNMRQHMVTHKGHDETKMDNSSPNSKVSKSRSGGSKSSKSRSLISRPMPASTTFSLPSSTGTHQNIPIAPALFTYPQYGNSLGALPGSIAAILGQAITQESASVKDFKSDILNQKREREVEVPLPMSKRSNSVDVDTPSSSQYLNKLSMDQSPLQLAKPTVSPEIVSRPPVSSATTQVLSPNSPSSSVLSPYSSDTHLPSSGSELLHPNSPGGPSHSSSPQPLLVS